MANQECDLQTLKKFFWADTLYQHIPDSLCVNYQPIFLTRTKMEPQKKDLSISKVVASYISIEDCHNGKFKAVCPFHDDNAPSLSIVECGDDGAGFYHCFACQASGDVFSFVQKKENISFPEAKKKVFSICGFAVDTDTDHEFIAAFRAETIKKLEKRIEKFEKISWKKEIQDFLLGCNFSIFFFQNELWQFKKNKWERLEQYEIETMIINHLSNRYGEPFVSSTKINEMNRFLSALAPRIRKNNDFIFSSVHFEEKIITSFLTKTEIVSIKSDGDTIHKPLGKNSEFFSTQTWQVDSSNGRSGCPLFLSFLDRIQPEDARKRLIIEMMGYLLVPDNRCQKFFILNGIGSNGKSVFLNILKHMIGEGGFTSLSLDQMEKDFVLADTCGKVANICADMGELDKAGEGNLKSYTSGDDITCNRKYLSTITFKPTAKLIFSTNNIPRFSDKTEGIWRRMIVIPFDTVIPDEEQDEELFEKIKLEIDGIFSLAIAGLQRLIKNKWKFTLSES